MKTLNRLLAAAAFISAIVLPVAAQAEQETTYANPIDIDYRYNFEQMTDGISYRTGADPAVVVFKGQYYLFETSR